MSADSKGQAKKRPNPQSQAAPRPHAPCPYDHHHPGLAPNFPAPRLHADDHGYLVKGCAAGLDRVLPYRGFGSLASHRHVACLALFPPDHALVHAPNHGPADHAPDHAHVAAPALAVGLSRAPDPALWPAPCNRPACLWNCSHALHVALSRPRLRHSAPPSFHQRPRPPLALHSPDLAPLLVLDAPTPRARSCVSTCQHSTVTNLPYSWNTACTPTCRPLSGQQGVPPLLSNPRRPHVPCLCLSRAPDCLSLLWTGHGARVCALGRAPPCCANDLGGLVRVLDPGPGPGPGPGSCSSAHPRLCLDSTPSRPSWKPCPHSPETSYWPPPASRRQGCGQYFERVRQRHPSRRAPFPLYGDNHLPWCPQPLPRAFCRRAGLSPWCDPSPDRHGLMCHLDSGVLARSDRSGRSLLSPRDHVPDPQHAPLRCLRCVAQTESLAPGLLKTRRPPLAESSTALPPSHPAPQSAQVVHPCRGHRPPSRDQRNS